ncbi:thioredoxin domain-containing protein, partial [bacterium]|nr:thioredoxin domain-containing protein [bacterium]
DTKRLLATVYGRFLPNKVVCLLDPADGAGGEDLTPLLKGKAQKGGRATAYVCQNFTCSAPVTEAGELEALLEG